MFHPLIPVLSVQFSAFSSILANIVYGKELQGENDPYMALVDMIVPAFIEAAIPGKFLVDILPALKYIPACVPGAGFQRKAAQLSKAVVKYHDDPWNEAKAKLRRNMLKDCVAKEMLHTLSKDGSDTDAEQVAKPTCATASLGM